VPAQPVAGQSPEAGVEISDRAAEESPAKPRNQEAVAPAEATTPAFTVLVEPLREEARDPLVLAAARDYFAALLDGLRAIPGLVLVGPDEAIDAAATKADFRLTAVARPGGMTPFGAQWQWQVDVRLHVQTGAKLVQPFMTGGMIGGPLPRPDCRPLVSAETPTEGNCDPAIMAA
jgi:hypothetical protein